LFHVQTVFPIFFPHAFLDDRSCQTNQGTKEEHAVNLYYEGIMQSRQEKNRHVIEKGIIEQDMQGVFKGLNYFEPDSTYRVSARIVFHSA